MSIEKNWTKVMYVICIVSFLYIFLKDIGLYHTKEFSFFYSLVGLIANFIFALLCIIREKVVAHKEILTHAARRYFSLMMYMLPLSLAITIFFFVQGG